MSGDSPVLETADASGFKVAVASMRYNGCLGEPLRKRVRGRRDAVIALRGRLSK